MPNPTGKPRTPTPIGSWPYTLYDCVGQKRMTEKKLAPEIKVMMSVITRIRGFCHRRRGNMGYLAPHISQATNAMRQKIPSSKGASTCAECHLYYPCQPHFPFPSEMMHIPGSLPMSILGVFFQLRSHISPPITHLR